MKTKFLVFVLGIGLMYSCNEKDDEIFQTLQEEMSIVKFDFEKGNEGFVTSILGDFPSGKEILNVVDEKNHCGRLYRGESADFKTWNGYDFKGNPSSFIGLNMGSCLGYFRSASQVEFSVDELLRKQKTKIKFKYYRPGDFTGWSGNSYGFKLSISKKTGVDELKTPILTYEPVIINKGWGEFEMQFTEDLPKGEYYLIVSISGGGAAIDDIEIITEI